jgi:hypothetical protein
MEGCRAKGSKECFYGCEESTAGGVGSKPLLSRIGGDVVIFTAVISIRKCHLVGGIFEPYRELIN